LAEWYVAAAAQELPYLVNRRVHLARVSLDHQKVIVDLRVHFEQRLVGNIDGLVLIPPVVLAHKEVFLFSQYPDHSVGLGVDEYFLAQHLDVWKEFVGYVGAYYADLRPVLIFKVGKESTLCHFDRSHSLVSRCGSLDRGHIQLLILVANIRNIGRADILGDVLDRWAQLLDRFAVLERYGFAHSLFGREPSRVNAGIEFVHEDRIRPKCLNCFFELLVESGNERRDHHNGDRSDQHAQYGQEGPEFVVLEGGQCHPKALQQVMPFHSAYSRRRFLAHRAQDILREPHKMLSGATRKSPHSARNATIGSSLAAFQAG